VGTEERRHVAEPDRTFMSMGSVSVRIITNETTGL
jgi:hypothetical protein